MVWESQTGRSKPAYGSMYDWNRNHLIPNDTEKKRSGFEVTIFGVE